MPIEKQPKKRVAASKTPKTKKPRSAVLVSATGKIHDHKLKESLHRARKRRAFTYLVDAAVPTSLRRDLQTQSSDQSTRAHVHIRKHALSPFVLHLSNEALPTPEQLLREEDLIPVRLNLLEGSTTSSAELADTTNDLILSRTELQAQLEEDLLLNTEIAAASPSVHHPRSFDVLLPYARGIKLPEHMTLSIRDQFEPVHVPDDILSYFDLPEEDEEGSEVLALEEEEPDEILDLDLLEAELEEEERETFVSNTHDSAPRPSWMPFGWKRAIAGFVAISFVFVLPLHAMNLVQELRDAKSNVETSSYGAIDLLKDGAGAALGRDVSQANTAFTGASVRFTQAQETLNRLDTGTQVLLNVLPVTRGSYKTGESLVSAGKSLSIAAARLTEGFKAMEQDMNPTPVTRSELLRTYMQSALPHVEDAQTALERVRVNDLPEDYRNQFAQLQTSLPLLLTSMHELDEMVTFAQAVLGSEGSKRYLLIFQNNTEIRPTGGFMGSFAELKVRDGVIERMDVPGGGTYDLQGSLKTNLIAPKPLQLLKARWEFQDANWFPDFPTSARQMIQFYTDSGGPSVDGVIAINATYVADLLTLLGPVEMPEYGRVIDSENFLFEAQKIVELEYDKEENKPKQFIGDLAPILLERALKQSSEQFMDFVDVLGKGLETRDIQLYLADDLLEQTVRKHGWGGAVAQTNGDYLMIVDTNLGGGKTDRVIEEQASLDVNIADDGTVTNTLTIKRTHHGMKQELFAGVNNVNYLRVYVPKGAKLVHSSGFAIPDARLFKEPDPEWTIDDDLYYSVATEETDAKTGTQIFEESGKTVFGNWVQTAPGTTSTTQFVYTLPFTIGSNEAPTWTHRLKTFAGIPKTDVYTLILQKQSGVMDRTTEVHVNAPTALTPLWSSLTDQPLFSNNTDAFIGLLFDTSSL